MRCLHGPSKDRTQQNIRDPCPGHSDGCVSLHVPWQRGDGLFFSSQCSQADGVIVYKSKSHGAAVITVSDEHVMQVRIVSAEDRI